MPPLGNLMTLHEMLARALVAHAHMTREQLFKIHAMMRNQEGGTPIAPQNTPLAQGWCVLSLLHERIQAHIEHVLQSEHELSVREFSLLDVLSRQEKAGDHLHMKQVAEAVVLSQSATTRLVTRLEERGLLSRFLCPTDRRGIYTDVTKAGLKLLEAAKPTNRRALNDALALARKDSRLLPLVRVLEERGYLGHSC